MNQININHIIPNPLKHFGFTESQIWDNQITFNKGEYYQIVAHFSTDLKMLLSAIIPIISINILCLVKLFVYVLSYCYQYLTNQ